MAALTVIPFMSLQVKTEWENYTFELKPGESVIFGRSPDCRVPIPRASVSLEHLKVTWTGAEIKVEDLGSSNGTFRLPQQSPFASASFGPKIDSLQLRLSKTDLTLSWEPLSFGDLKTGAEPTATEVAPDAPIEKTEQASPHSGISLHLAKATQLGKNDISSDKTKLSRFAQSVVHQPGAAAPSHTQIARAGALDLEDVTGLLKDNRLAVQDALSPKGAQAAVPAPEGRMQTEVHVSSESASSMRAKIAALKSEALGARKVAAWSVATFLCATLLVASLLAGRAVLQGILKQPSFLLLSGGFHDVMLVYSLLFRNKLEWILGPWLASLALILWLRHRLLKSEIAPMRRLESFFAGLRVTSSAPFKLICAFLAVAALAWPALWAARYHVRPNQWKAYFRYWDVVQTGPFEAAKKVIELKTLLPALEGSSLLYKQILLYQRLRVLNECGGVGESATWDQKRTCLVLLSVASIEILQDVRPMLMLDVAQRAAILLSLDGITRTIVVEGRNSTPVVFFLNSLDAVGLSQEKDDIQKIIERSDLSDLEMTNLLRELRKRIEIRMQIRQAELALPSIFYLDIPGPLESGI